MNVIKKIFSLIQRIFNKEEIKMIEAPTQHYNHHEKSKFVQSLKIVNAEKKKKVETLVCEGDGLGIQNKIVY